MYRFFIVIIIAFISCNKNKEYINRQSDYDLAKTVVKDFYKKLSSEDDFYPLFSNKISEFQSKESINEIIEFADIHGGTREGSYIKSWYTKVVEGNTPSSNYGIEFYVIRSKVNTQEIFELIKERDSIKIINYRLNLDIGNIGMPDVLREKYDN